ncbi:helix-turn-helix domain-containing protein [Amycolatopsis silviterrae]|uniref:Helix-turn-helix domain-containing protein n=1 Tax=Amycolatopsis silviterrae TaxID=1656914 RepID=A0ABW5HIF6_9PSEU
MVSEAPRPRLSAVPGPAERDRFWASVEELLDELARGLVARIRAELPSYARLPEDEHFRNVRSLYATMTRSLADGAPPNPEVLQSIRASARRRAYYGMPVYDVLAAFHYAHRELWEALRRSDLATESLLVELVGTMAHWSQAMSQAVVDAYVAQQGGREQHERETRARFFDLLHADGPSEGVADVLRELAFDPDGEFTVLVAGNRSWPRESVDALQRAGRRITGVLHVDARAGLMTVVSQGAAVDDVVALAAEVGGEDQPLGIGLARPGLAGIRLSMGDAARALRLAEAGGRAAVRFEAEWFRATIPDLVPLIGPLVEPARRVAAEQPDLADAVVAYAESGFTLRGTGSALALHPNSVSYRLSRWHQLTGLDVRSFAELALSFVAVAEARRTT